tara:strand:+ start:1121 stop:1567 length:447 start_codon:yes stop_codon:yes gene_type:complete
MNIERLKKQITLSEGIRSQAYPDPLDPTNPNKMTIAIGHLIKLPDEEYLLKAKLKDYEIEQIFMNDLNQAIDDARKFIDENSIHPRAFEIIVDMAFNLGLPRLSTFKRLKQALIDNNYVLASEEMLASRWHRQLPHRSSRLAEEMRDI